MKRLLLPLAFCFVIAACDSTPTAVSDEAVAVAEQSAPDLAVSKNGNACWGQASKVFAQMGEMGTHSSSQGNPRLGLRNLARALANDGVIPDDSMHSLGVFVANELGLTIEACL